MQDARHWPLQYDQVCRVCGEQVWKHVCVDTLGGAAAIPHCVLFEAGKRASLRDAACPAVLYSTSYMCSNLYVTFSK